METKSNNSSKKTDEKETIRTVEDLYALYFPNAYDRKLEEKIFESYSKPAHQLMAASVLCE